MAQQHVIYVTRRIHEDVRRHLERAGSVVEWEENYPIPQQHLLKVIEHVEALYCMPNDRITREVIEAGEQLRVICTVSVRYDHIDIAAAAERGIIVCHTPGLSDDAIADFTMLLLLVFARHLLAAQAFVKERKWKYWSPELFLGTELSGSALGIIGLGNVGIRVAHRALGFAMRVLYYDPQRNEDAETLIGIQYGSLDNVLREADFIVLHVPLTPATRGLINSERFRLMKPNAIIINMSGGRLSNMMRWCRPCARDRSPAPGWMSMKRNPFRWTSHCSTSPTSSSPHISAAARYRRCTA